MMDLISAVRATLTQAFDLFQAESEVRLAESRALRRLCCSGCKTSHWWRDIFKISLVSDMGP